MAVERKLLTCQNCGDHFTVPRGRGRYPDYCDKPECARVDYRKPWAEQTQAARARYNAQRRERRRASKETSAGTATLDRAILHPELSAILERTQNHRRSSRPELGREVRLLAYAEGAEPTYERLLELAACALSWAARIRPNEIIPDAPEKPTEDFRKLMEAA